MKHYAHRKGGYAATPDGFDRSDPFTLASLIDEWFLHLEERNYAAKTVSTHSWSLKMFLSWAQERDLNRPEEITKPILESYQRWLYRYRKANDQPLGVTTQRARWDRFRASSPGSAKAIASPRIPPQILSFPENHKSVYPKR